MTTTSSNFTVQFVWLSVWLPFHKKTISGSREFPGDLDVLVMADHVVGDRAGNLPDLQLPLGAATTFRLPRELTKPVSSSGSGGFGEARRAVSLDQNVGVVVGWRGGEGGYCGGRCLWAAPWCRFWGDILDANCQRSPSCAREAPFIACSKPHTFQRSIPRADTSHR